jgi:hypothetical protein
MKNKELLSAFNKLMTDKKIPFQFSDWDGVSKLTNEELSFIFNKISNLLTTDGIGEDGELNQLGLFCDDICGRLSLEMVRRPEFKLDVIQNKQ